MVSTSPVPTNRLQRKHDPSCANSCCEPCSRPQPQHVAQGSPLRWSWQAWHRGKVSQGGLDHGDPLKAGWGTVWRLATRFATLADDDEDASFDLRALLEAAGRAGDGTVF